MPLTTCLLVSLFISTSSILSPAYAEEAVPHAAQDTQPLESVEKLEDKNAKPLPAIPEDSPEVAYHRTQPIPDYHEPYARAPLPTTRYGAGHDRSKTVTISVQHADLAEVFEMMSKHGQVNILMASGVQGQVSINLYDIDLHEAIRAVAIAAGFAVEKSGNTYFVVTRDDAGKEIVGGLTKVKSFKVQYSDPEAVSVILQDHLSRYGKVTALPERRLIIVEDLPEFLERIEGLLEEVDHQPVQIMIEAQILEVKLTREEKYGIDWNKLFRIGDFQAEVTGLNGPTNGLSFAILDKVDLRFLSDKSRVRTLSTPKLLALEHQEAEVIVGDRRGYIERRTDASGNTTESIAFLESGVILRVTPFIDRSGKIMMQIHPEVSTGNLINELPFQNTTEVTTQLLANDGETIFIGGLIKNNDDNARKSVPVLGDIPVLGYAFRQEDDNVTNTETVVMITPRIVKSGVPFYSSEKVENEIKVREVDVKLKQNGEVIDDYFKDHKPVAEKWRHIP